MLPEKTLVHVRAGAVSAGIPPAVEKITAFTPASTGMSGGLGRGCAVVDDPDFIEGPDAQHDLVKLGVVGDRIDVRPVPVALRSFGRARTYISYGPELVHSAAHG